MLGAMQLTNCSSVTSKTSFWSFNLCALRAVMSDRNLQKLFSSVQQPTRPEHTSSELSNCSRLVGWLVDVVVIFLETAWSLVCCIVCVNLCQFPSASVVQCHLLTGSYQQQQQHSQPGRRQSGGAGLAVLAALL